MIRKYLPLVLCAGIIVCWQWLLPVALPFLLGASIAFLAEPLTARLSRRLPRGASAGIAVTAVLIGLLTLIVLALSVLVRQLTALAGQVPAQISPAQGSLLSLKETLLSLSARAPKSLRSPLKQGLEGFFSDGGSFVEGALRKLPDAAVEVVALLTDSFLALGTGCIAAYMLASRLPRVRELVTAPPEGSLWARLLPRVKRVKSALFCWLKAQGKLSAVCFSILLAGFLLLGIPWAPLWALLIALVDAVPLLGTGTVLVPWALFSFLQHRTAQGLGLLGIYVTAALTRSILEPRLVGTPLGLDPLISLAAIYAGYLFCGFGGIILAPIRCVAVKEAVVS